MYVLSLSHVNIDWQGAFWHLLLKATNHAESSSAFRAALCFWAHSPIKTTLALQSVSSLSFAQHWRAFIKLESELLPSSRSFAASTCELASKAKDLTSLHGCNRVGTHGMGSLLDRR